ncbi:Sporulation related domain protein [compost metagenome]
MKKLLYLTLSLLLIVNKLGYSQDKKSGNQPPKAVSTGKMIGPEMPGAQSSKPAAPPSAAQTPKEQAPQQQSLESVDHYTEDVGTYTVKRRISNVSKGYRIQIYSGPDREKAKSVKIDFMKRFPSVRSYITYASPYYRIRVGDFRSRQEAGEFYRYLGQSYTVMIVPSLINNRIPPKPAGLPGTNLNTGTSSKNDSAH